MNLKNSSDYSKTYEKQIGSPFYYARESNRLSGEKFSSKKSHYSIFPSCMGRETESENKSPEHKMQILKQIDRNGIYYLQR